MMSSGHRIDAVGTVCSPLGTHQNGREYFTSCKIICCVGNTFIAVVTDVFKRISPMFNWSLNLISIAWGLFIPNFCLILSFLFIFGFNKWTLRKRFPSQKSTFLFTAIVVFLLITRSNKAHLLLYTSWGCMGSGGTATVIGSGVFCTYCFVGFKMCSNTRGCAN